MNKRTKIGIFVAAIITFLILTVLVGGEVDTGINYGYGYGYGYRF